MPTQIEFQRLYELVKSAQRDLALVECDNLFEQECHTCNAVDALNALSLKLLQMEQSFNNLLPLFTEALAWGMVYGPEIPPTQWDEMRDSMAAQFVAKVLDRSTPVHKDLSDLECEHIIKAAIVKDAERLRIAPEDVQTDIFRNRTLGRSIVRASREFGKTQNV